jgi:CheY-like chemotaxis protein
VRDDGIGIAPDLLPRIFDLFVQATRASDRAHGGLGIGLTLVQQLVKLHGGSVAARSDGLGHGSEFSVRLPILPGPLPAPVPTAAAPARDVPCRMLIVDDNEDSARSMATLQRLRGHETRAAFTGPEAVVVAAEFIPEVVLLDIGLPGLDGYEVARRLRAMPALAGAFLVAMTGYASDEDRGAGKDAGFDEYLVKPVDLDILREWLRRRTGDSTGKL